MKRKLLSLSLASTMIFTSQIGVFAAENPISYLNDDMVSTQSINTPAFYEYKSYTKQLNKDQYITLYNRAKNARSSGSFSDYMGLFSTASGLVPELGILSISTGFFSYMKSDININNICDTCFNNYVLLDKYVNSKTLPTEFKLKRFFDGNQMHEWYLSDIYTDERYND